MRLDNLSKYFANRPIYRASIREQDIFLDISTPWSFYRARTLLTKEPKTISWLDRMLNDDVFYDVGANVGIYSIYAAVIDDAKVVDFEPDGRSFGILCRNIELNRLAGKVIPYCLGVSDRDGADLLRANSGIGGESGHQVGGNKQAAVLQGLVTTRLDSFVIWPGVPAPTAIKIDVDGLEHLVIKGLGNLARIETLRSLNIEIDTKREGHLQAVKNLEVCGFKEEESLRHAHRNPRFLNVVLDR